MAPCGTEAPSTNGASAAAATVFMADAKVKEISVSELIDARPLGRYQFALSGSASSWCYSWVQYADHRIPRSTHCQRSSDSVQTIRPRVRHGAALHGSERDD